MAFKVLPKLSSDLVRQVGHFLECECAGDSIVPRRCKGDGNVEEGTMACDNRDSRGVLANPAHDPNSIPPMKLFNSVDDDALRQHKFTGREFAWRLIHGSRLGVDDGR